MAQSQKVVYMDPPSKRHFGGASAIYSETTVVVLVLNSKKIRS